MAKIAKSAELGVRRSFIWFLSRKARKNPPPLPLHLPGNPTIVFLRQDRLGDAIVTTPLLVALHEKFPSAHLIMLLGENNKGIAPLLPVKCETHIYRKDFFKDWSMLRKLRNRNIDVLIDLMDNPSATSSILTAAIGAKYSIGIEKDNASSYNVLVPQIDRRKYHIGRRIAELLRPFGIDPDSIDLKPKLRIKEQKTVKGRIGLNISVGKPSCWVPPHINAEICKELTKEDEIREILVFAHPKSKSEQDEIVRSAGNAKVKAAPVTYSYNDFAKEIASCEFLLTPDTSVVHLASGLGIPMVAYYPPSPPDLHYWTPIGVPYQMIVKEDLSDLDAKEVTTAFDLLRAEVMHETINLEEAIQ